MIAIDVSFVVCCLTLPEAAVEVFLLTPLQSQTARTVSIQIH